jgi:hypothetical protein
MAVEYFGLCRSLRWCCRFRLQPPELLGQGFHSMDSIHQPAMTPHPVDLQTMAITATRSWLERAVIGLQLCPFANAVYLKEQIRITVSMAKTTGELRHALEIELRGLSQTDPSVLDTTLLIHPLVLADFLDFNDFLAVANDTVEAEGLRGVVQIASFHPAYQFAGTSVNDITNFTNRSPYPMLQLLREASISRAVGQYPDAQNIYRRNIETMRRLGVTGWAGLKLDAPARPEDAA